MQMFESADMKRFQKSHPRQSRKARRKAFRGVGPRDRIRRHPFATSRAKKNGGGAFNWGIIGCEMMDL